MSLSYEFVIENSWIEAIAKQAYLNLQWSKGYFSVAHKTFFTRLKTWIYPEGKAQTVSLDSALISQLQARMEQLLDQDWQDAKAGVYPWNLLFDEPWDDFMQFYLPLCADIPVTWQRALARRHQEFSPRVDTSNYPDYYLQTFHNQTDGYLTDESANFYDLQVELLFGGNADAMRRRILAPLKRSLLESFGPIAAAAQSVNALAGNPGRQLQLVDLACGTGRTLLQLQRTFPSAQLYGLDLSPAYLRKAKLKLSPHSALRPQWCQGNAEYCPYADESVHGVTSVFLLHELPPQARQKVLEESFRILKPGGCLVLCDSIQLADSSDFSPMMQNFATLFHEPYYQSYVRDDLSQRLRQIGYQEIETEVHFLSKYWIACKSQ